MLSQKSIPGNHLVVYVDNDFDDDDDGDTYDFGVVVIIIGMMMMLMIIMVTMFDLESVGAYQHFNWRSCRQFARRKNARNVRTAHFQRKMRAGHIFKWSRFSKLLWLRALESPGHLYGPRQFHFENSI